MPHRLCLALHFSLTSGEHYNPGLIQSTYCAVERKRFAPNLIGSGKNLGEDSCLLTQLIIIISAGYYYYFFTNTFFFFPLCFLFIQSIHCVDTKSKCWECKRNTVNPPVLDSVQKDQMSLLLGKVATHHYSVLLGCFILSSSYHLTTTWNYFNLPLVYCLASQVEAL